ncbi:MAG: coiled-coil domain-containing protein, partial [Candidatus Latescibacterota bacterium]
ATAKSRTRALARRLRKSGRMASLTADISEGIERIAELSDRIIESFELARHATERIARESKEGARLLGELSADSREATELSAGNVLAIEELLTDFRLNTESIRHLIAAIQNAAEHHSEVLKTSQELSRKSGEFDALDSRLNSLLERSDIAGLNAALEAGKAGDGGAGFAVVASMAQKAYAIFSRKAGDFTGLTAQIKTGHEKLAGRTTEAAERIRAIVVMTKGVRNAFDDAAGVIDTLRMLIRESASRILGVFEGLDAAAPVLDAAPGSVERSFGTIDMAAGRIEDQEKSFAEAADSAERLLGSAGRLAAVEDLAAALDDIYTDADAFIRSLAATQERLDLTLESVHTAAHEMELLQQGTGTNRETLVNLIETVEKALDQAHSFRDRAEALRRNLENALTVLRDVFRELGSLREDEEIITAELDALRPLYAAIPRFAGRAGSFAGTMAFLSVSGGVEMVRAGEAGAGFAALPVEFENIAAESSDLEDTVGDLAALLGDRHLAMSRKQGLMDWRGLAEAFGGTIESMQTMIESRIGGAINKGESLAAALAGHGRSIANVLTRTDEVVTASEGAVKAVIEAARLGDDQKDVFRQTLNLAEKVTTLADEIYPEE